LTEDDDETLDMIAQYIDDKESVAPKWPNEQGNLESQKHQHISICMLPKEVGPCAAGIRAYYFDNYTKKCRKFLYGGCKGNANRFHSLKHCRRACLRQPNVPQYGL